MDVLSDILQRSRARGAAFAQTSAHGRWGVRFAPMAGLAAHSALAGEVHVLVDGDERDIRLLPGDVALVRGTHGHRLTSDPNAPAITIEELIDRGPVAGTARSFSLGDPGRDEPGCTFFCGAYLFDGDLGDDLLEALPTVVHLRPEPHETLHTALALLARELVREDAGQQTLLDRLLDVVLVQAVRTHLTARGDDAPGWFRATSDPDIAASLRALHADPARPWTVGDLAAVAAMSRSSFAHRFAELVGTPPLRYLTAWRMALARERLRDTDDRLATIATSLGYGSEFSFASTFKRETGTAPGQWRNATRESACQP